tara:strand:+ start:420 stop:809 length:390 start_codon:yes stop_codon:yes gene_type:complete
VKDNIIDFNKAFEKRKRLEKEIDDLILESDEQIVDFFSTLNARETVWALRGFDFDIESDPRSMLDILTIIEATKSLMWRARGKDYPFQTFADTVFESVQDESGFKMEQMLEHFIAEMEEYYDSLDDYDV